MESNLAVSPDLQGPKTAIEIVGRTADKVEFDSLLAHCRVRSWLQFDRYAGSEPIHHTYQSEFLELNLYTPV